MRAAVRALALVALVLAPTGVWAQGPGELAGSLDVSGVDARVDGEAQDTLRQLYTVNFLRGITNSIDVRLGLRYFKFDLDIAEAIGSFQEQIQPSADLSWTHPSFRFTATGTRRVSRSNSISGELINDTLLLDWVSAWRQTPKFNLRYELQDSEETGADAFRNVKNRRLTGSVEWRRDHETFDYQITQNWTENVISGIDTSDLTQRFLYRGNHYFGERRAVTTTSSYRYTRRDRTSEVTTGDRFLELVEPSRGLGAVDLTPPIDPLPEVPALIDGNTVAPVFPPLGIGAGLVDRNVGADLGLRRDQIGAIYVYTDRLSAATVTWSLWVSDDNLTWTEPAGAAVRSRFDPALLRYEIEFEPVAGRYVKVVNAGVNSVADVQVTEIVVFEAIEGVDSVDDDASAHFADGRVVWNANERWRISGDGAVRLEPPSGSVSQRLSFDYGLQARYSGRAKLTHVARLAQSWVDEEGGDRDLRDDTVSYSLLYDPLPTVGSSLAMTLRQVTEASEVSQRAATALLSTTATPWPALRTTVEVGASRLDQLVIDFLIDSWQTRAAIDAEVTRQLGFNVTWFHQESLNGPDRILRVVRRLNAAAELQLTSAIFGRAGIGVFDDLGTSVNERYLLSWRLFTRLLVTGQANIDTTADGLRSARYSVNGNFDLFRRFLGLRNVTAYAQFSDVDQVDTGGSRILSWQLGARATF